MSDSTRNRPTTRRRLLAAAGALGTACAVDMFAVEPRWLEIGRHSIVIDGLEPSLDGFTLVQISDAHLGNAGVAIGTLAKAVRAVNPQLIVLTGDMVESESELPVLADLCKRLWTITPSIVAAVGNWEHWGNIPIERLQSTYRDTGAKLLVNQSEVVEGLWIAATDDGLGGMPDWRATAKEPPAGAPRVLLTHSPALLDGAPDDIPTFDLALAGHTHGGQASVGGWTPAVPPGSGRFIAGHYTTKIGPAYVSRGTGTSVIPGRFLCRPEMPVFELVRG